MILKNPFSFAAPPRIVLDPPYQIVRQGDSARIICTATGDQPIQIQWAKQGQPYLPRSVTARGGQLAFQSISLDDQGKLAKLPYAFHYNPLLL